MADTIMAEATPAPIPRIPPTLYAGPYSARFLKQNVEILPLLQHVNCSLLSTRGQVPTLLDLKQHVRSLLVLIKHLTISTTTFAVDDPTSPLAQAIAALRTEAGHKAQQVAAGDATVAEQITGEAFDFIADLGVLYENSDPVHNTALTGILNSLEDRGTIDRNGRDHCPLHESPMADFKRAQALPYAETWKLIKHADDLLERLDHEFSAEGGILAILPLDVDGNEVHELGRRSVLGQWIAFTRRLVSRNLELTLSLTEVLNIASGEAVIPRLLLSDTPVMERVKRNVDVASTEGWVISLGTGKAEELNSAFAKREGVVFNHEIHEAGGGEGEQDLITVDVVTRYSRLRGGKTIFITPGAVTPPALRPGVVQVVKGEYRQDRSTAWEQRNREEMERLRRLEQHTLPQLREECASQKAAIEVYKAERKTYLLVGGKLPFSENSWKEMRDHLKGTENVDYETQNEEVAAFNAATSNKLRSHSLLLADARKTMLENQQVKEAEMEAMTAALKAKEDHLIAEVEKFHVGALEWREKLEAVAFELGLGASQTASDLTPGYAYKPFEGVV